jgi:hypothetical protein
MRVKAKLLPILCLVCFCNTLCGQNAIEVSEPVLSLKNSKVHIEYQLLNTSKSEKFSIRIAITNQRGNSIDARSLSGDLGKGISGGGNKRIIWDIEADSIFLDEEIFVEVYALPESPPVPVVPPEEQITEKKTPEEDPEEAPGEESSSGKELNRISLIAQSIAFPGLGLSRLNRGTPHWLRGVAGYGCLAGSIYFNRKAWSSYQDYLGSENPADVDELFDRAYNEKKTSGILGYAALGIWVADLAWTIIGTSGMKKDQLSIRQKGLSIGTTVEPVSNVPLIALRYKF